MKRHIPLAVAGIALAGVVWASSGQSQAAAPGRPQWEYQRVEATELGGINGLARLGNYGWELVTVHTELTAGITRANGSTTYENQSYFYFKRPR